MLKPFLATGVVLASITIPFVLNGCKGNDEDIEVDMEAAFKRKMEILKIATKEFEEVLASENVDVQLKLERRRPCQAIRTKLSIANIKMHADFRMHEWSDSQNQEWGSKYVKKIKAEKKIKDAARDKCWARTRYLQANYHMYEEFIDKYNDVADLSKPDWHDCQKYTEEFEKWPDAIATEWEKDDQNPFTAEELKKLQDLADKKIAPMPHCLPDLEKAKERCFQADPQTPELRTTGRASSPESGRTKSKPKPEAGRKFSKSSLKTSSKSKSPRRKSGESLDVDSEQCSADGGPEKSLNPKAVIS